jgi:hypothetical protein
MDHAIIPCSLKHVLGCGTHIETTSITTRKRCKSDHVELEVPKRHISMPNIVRCHGPLGFAVREAKDILSLQKLKNHDKEMSF